MKTIVALALGGWLFFNSPIAAQDLRNVYALGSGDKVRVVVFGEKELSGEFEVDGNGYISMPLIGEVIVGRRTLRESERTIEAMLKNGFLKIPRVSIEVLNYRPFYILGEVKSPGSYPFVNGMTILNAVVLGGGFTYRADEKDIVVKQANDPDQRETNVGLDSPVLPGDIIRVEERFF